MASSIGDFNRGLVGVSHTTGSDYKAMPSKAAIRPISSTLTVHTDKTMKLDDSGDKLMEFARGSCQHAYSPQENREQRDGVINASKNLAEELKASGGSEEQVNQLMLMAGLFQSDADLDVAATMARNLLIPA